MIRTGKRLTLCAGLLMCNVLFIWVNSLLPREVSAAFSQLVGDLLNFLFPGPDIPSSGEGHGVLRKLAHFTEFCTLGVLLSWLTGMLRQKPWERMAVPFLAGTAVACVDETIQLFVPGRGPGFLDVMIDAAGVLVGVGLLWLTVKLRRRSTNVSRRKTY